MDPSLLDPALAAPNYATSMNYQPIHNATTFPSLSDYASFTQATDAIDSDDDATPIHTPERSPSPQQQPRPLDGSQTTISQSADTSPASLQTFDGQPTRPNVIQTLPYRPANTQIIAIPDQILSTLHPSINLASTTRTNPGPYALTTISLPYRPALASLSPYTPPFHRLTPALRERIFTPLLYFNHKTGTMPALVVALRTDRTGNGVLYKEALEIFYRNSVFWLDINRCHGFYYSRPAVLRRIRRVCVDLGGIWKAQNLDIRMHIQPSKLTKLRRTLYSLEEIEFTYCFNEYSAVPIREEFTKLLDWLSGVRSIRKATIRLPEGLAVQVADIMRDNWAAIDLVLGARVGWYGQVVGGGEVFWVWDAGEGNLLNFGALGGWNWDSFRAMGLWREVAGL